MEEGCLMYHRRFFAMHSEKLQQKVAEFTKSQRFWTAFPADTLETILRHYNILPKDFHYAHFNPETNEAIFVGPPELDESAIPEGVEALPANDPFLLPAPTKQIPPKVDEKP